MIIYITLAYGLIVTAGAVGVYLRSWAELRNRRNPSARFWQRRAFLLETALIEADDRLRKIEQQRHYSAKRARAAQIAQRKAQVLAKAAELQVDRIAA